jgi:arginase
MLQAAALPRIHGIPNDEPLLPWHAFIGAPTDVGNFACGAAEGPRALRDFGLLRCLRQVGLVADMGDVEGPSYDGASDASGCRSLASTVAWCAAVRDLVARTLGAGGRPLLVGGDHSMALGSIAAASAYARARGWPFYVLWFDAHPDFNTPDTSPSGNTHGFPAAAACGFGHPEMVGLGGFVPLLEPGRLYQFGIRDIDRGEMANLRQAGVCAHDMQAVRTHGLERLVRQTLDAINAAGGGYVHVSFDLDALDPADAPGVGTPVPGGLSLSEASAALRILGASGLVRSFDLVELAADRDSEGRTCMAAERLLTAYLSRHEQAAAPLQQADDLAVRVA